MPLQPAISSSVRPQPRQSARGGSSVQTPMQGEEALNIPSG